VKLIDLDSTYREWLNFNSALVFDGDLNERFIGLTHTESIFFAEMSTAALQPVDIRTVAELKRFIELHELHEHSLAFQRKTRSLEN
jgi:hypothetical protein